MFDRLMRAAERAADGVSRRQFLGRLGRGAAAVAAGLAGATAAAAGPNRTCDGPYTGSNCVGFREGQSCYISALEGNGVCSGAPNCVCVKKSRGGGKPRGR